MTMPTEAEVVERYQTRRDGDFFGFECSEYLEFMSWDAVKAFLAKTVTKEDFDKVAKPLTREKLLEVMKGYMPFAWEKANNFRGISSSRSISHYVAWTWMAGDKDLSAELEQEYEFYGKDKLVRICQFYGWDSSQWDDGVRKNSEDEE